MVEQELLQAIKQRLAEHYGARLKNVILYGSEARGEADESSDVDLLVLLDGPVEMGREIRAIIDCYYPVQLERKFFRPISALPADAEEYESRAIALYRSVREEGVSV